MTDDEERFAHPRVAAGVLYRDDEGRILLVKPTYKDGWDIPGGYVEDGESPRSAAIREVKEELGVDWPVQHLLVVDWAPHPDEGDKLLFIFDGGLIDGSALAKVDPDEHEIGSVGFRAVAEFAGLMPERLARRIAQASLRTGGQNYLEHGTAP